MSLGSQTAGRGAPPQGRRDIGLDSNMFRFIWRHSRRDQIFVLSLIAISLPFYFVSLDVPKRIVNDALQGRAFQDGNVTAKLFDWSFTLPDLLGGGRLVISEGFEFERFGYLFALSFFFLGLVVVNGYFKYVINIAKGVLGERMLRRIRFNMFSLLLQFRPEEIRSVKPAEAASMIKDEVEPVGGFVGEAFIQPAFLSTQALTALAFIMLQSLWLGLVALSIILVQAFVIPQLRREQLRLARERQIASRALAGRVGDIVEGVPAVHVHGTSAFNESEIGWRLGHLFDIRVRLFKRKFAVKYLNNFLAQITPFFFYAIGGYFALKGQLDLGQLVAVIAAYRDLPPPIKELIDWDQQRADVTVKYQQIISQFSLDRVLEMPRGAGAGGLAAADAPTALRIDGLAVSDRRGNKLLEVPAAELGLPAHIALVGGSGSGRDVLGKVLARQITEYQGTVRVWSVNLRDIPTGVMAERVAYAGPEPSIFAGSIRDNVLLALRRHEPETPAQGQAGAEFRRLLLEAEMSGNPSVSPDADWIDYTAGGIEGPTAVDAAVLDALAVVGLDEQVYRLGLLGRLPAEVPDEVRLRIVDARGSIRAALDSSSLSGAVTPFDPNAYNVNATVGENLVFGVPSSLRLSGTGLAADLYFRSIIKAEALVDVLVDVGLRLAETTLEVFRDMPPGHPLFERYSSIGTDELPDFEEIVDKARARGGRERFASQDRSRLIALALGYVEPRHRLGVVDTAFVARILRARQSFRRHLPYEYAGEIEFYDPERYNAAASVRDNLLFGKVALVTSATEDKLRDVIRSRLKVMGLDQVLYSLGLDFDVGPGGKQLFAPQRTLLNIARCLIKRPRILILDGALSGLGPTEASALLARIRDRMGGRTVIVTLADSAEAAGFDQLVTFQGPRPAEISKPRAAALGHEPASAPPSAEPVTVGQE